MLVVQERVQGLSGRYSSARRRLLRVGEGRL